MDLIRKNSFIKKLNKKILLIKKKKLGGNLENFYL